MQSRIFNYIYTQPTKNILYNPKLQNHINHCERVNVKYTTQENYKLNFRKEYFKIRPLFFSIVKQIIENSAQTGRSDDNLI